MLKNFNLQYLLYAVSLLSELAIAIISIYFILKKRLAESVLLFTGAVMILLNALMNLFMLYRMYVSDYPDVNTSLRKIITVLSSAFWVVGWICLVAGLFVLIQKYLRLLDAQKGKK